MSTTIETPAANVTSTIRQTLQVPAPHPVTFTNTQVATTITEIATNSGLVIERGHALGNKKARRNLKDLFANLQIGDKVNVATLREAMSITGSIRYRGWTSTMKKQGNGTFNVQRLA